VNPKVLAAGLLITLPLLGVLFLNLGRDPHALASPLLGRPAPPFTLPPLGGGTAVSQESLRGRPLVINFWASWCVPCVQEHPALLQAARQYGREVTFLGILYEDTEADAQAFLAEHGVAFPSLVDPGGRTAIAYGLGGVPETYFIDAQGRVVSKYVGPLDPGTLSARLEELRPR
jgi:cytochrome c biogenesis protein CcmG, thiol:disulfide interchange protein DsbE